MSFCLRLLQRLALDANPSWAMTTQAKRESGRTLQAMCAGMSVTKHVRASYILTVIVLPLVFLRL